MNKLTLPERGLICTALNKTYPNGMHATSETLQFFTDEQIHNACCSYGPAQYLLSKLDPAFGEGEC